MPAPGSTISPGAEANRGGEWHDGIERLMAAQLDGAGGGAARALSRGGGALNERGRLTTYPGSPALARAWLRPQDRLIACEIEPQAAVALRQNLRGDPRIKTLEIDGWTALGAYVPPKERRGLVLVDPPFEEDGDFFRLARGLAAAHRKWATGIYALWYPIKDPRRTRRAGQGACAGSASQRYCARNLSSPRLPIRPASTAAV